MKYELGFVGAGNMAEAIARAALSGGIMTADVMIAADPAPPRQHAFAQLDISTVETAGRVIAQSRHLVLAVKPQNLAAIAADLQSVKDDQIVISIMAGVSTKHIEATVGRSVRLVRVMPNTPLMAGCGMAGIALGAHARQADATLALRLFGAAGRAIMVEETDLDAITAISGSGPAYVFYLAEAMQKAATELGLAEHAALLVEQTILGAATLMRQSDDTAAVLRQKVTSPGGTTEAAVGHFDAHHLARIIVDGIEAARDRSLQLGQES